MFNWSYKRSRVILLGDLNYRISLPEATTRLLVERSEWNVLLENDQVISFNNKFKMFNYFLCN